jgi:outer membrane lipoprotein-sorting protein
MRNRPFCDLVLAASARAAHVVRTSFFVVPLCMAAVPTCARAAAGDVLSRTRAAYAALTTYADTGTVDAEFGTAPSMGRERHSFRTLYRAPRGLLFDFTKANNADRFVLWSDDEAFRTWWKATNATSNYPKGQGLSAFVSGSVPTAGALIAITPWLFQKSGLTGTLTELADIADAGTETIGGRPCHKLVGSAQSIYGATGHVTNSRRVTLWIDTETLLVRRIFEDASEGKVVSRKTYTFEPTANPRLDDAQFKFAPPTR